MKFFLLFTFFVALSLSAPTNCNFNDNNVLDFFNEEDTLEVLKESTLSFNKDCYLKNICTFPCKSNGYPNCDHVVYVELPNNHPMISEYQRVCINQLQVELKTIVLTYLLTPLNAMITHSAMNNQHNHVLSLSFEENLNEAIKQAKKDMEDLLKRVKRLCAKGLSNVSPQDKIKLLFGLEQKTIPTPIKEILKSFLDKAASILSKPCECKSFMTIPSRERTRGEDLCMKSCKRRKI